MRGVIAIGRGHAGKKILIALTGEKITVIERRAAEVGEEGIAAAIHPHLVMALKLNGIEHGKSPTKSRRLDMPQSLGPINRYR